MESSTLPLTTTPKPRRVSGSAKRLGLSATPKPPGEVKQSSQHQPKFCPKAIRSSSACEPPRVTALPESCGMPNILTSHEETTPKPCVPGLDLGAPTGQATTLKQPVEFATPTLAGPAAEKTCPGVAATSTCSLEVPASTVTTPQSACTFGSMTFTPSSQSSGTPSSSNQTPTSDDPTGELKYISKT